MSVRDGDVTTRSNLGPRLSLDTHPRKGDVKEVHVIFFQGSATNRKAQNNIVSVLPFYFLFFYLGRWSV
jgi:hypothetical protein